MVSFYAAFHDEEHIYIGAEGTRGGRRARGAQERTHKRATCALPQLALALAC